MKLPKITKRMLDLNLNLKLHIVTINYTLNKLKSSLMYIKSSVHIVIRGYYSKVNRPPHRVPIKLRHLILKEKDYLLDFRFNRRRKS